MQFYSSRAHSFLAYKGLTYEISGDHFHAWLSKREHEKHPLIIVAPDVHESIPRTWWDCPNHEGRQEKKHPDKYKFSPTNKNLPMDGTTLEKFVNKLMSLAHNPFIADSIKLNAEIVVLLHRIWENQEEIFDKIKDLEDRLNIPGNTTSKRFRELNPED
jgi:hypothetical protein